MKAPDDKLDEIGFLIFTARLDPNLVYRSSLIDHIQHLNVIILLGYSLSYVHLSWSISSEIDKVIFSGHLESNGQDLFVSIPLSSAVLTIHRMREM